MLSCGILKARILKWFAIPFSSGPHFVRTLHHDPSILGGPTQHGSQLHWVRQGCGPCDQIPQDWKRSVFILIPKKGNAKECSNYHTIALISHASEVMLKILQSRLQQYMNCKLPDVQPGFRKGRGTRDQIANIRWVTEKAREFQKNMYFCFMYYTKAFDCVDHNKLENSLRDGNTRPPDLPSEKTVCRSRSNS